MAPVLATHRAGSKRSRGRLRVAVFQGGSQDRAVLCQSLCPAVDAAPPPTTLFTLFCQETVLVKCSRPGHPSINKTFTFER